MADEQLLPATPATPPTVPRTALSATPQIRVGDVMTKEVLAIDANDTLDIIAGLFEKYDYDGMPVVDSEKKLLGIITGYDMILQSSSLHLPTLLKLMDQITHEGGDKKAIDQHFDKLHNIKATSIMNPKVITVTPESSIEEAARIFTDHHRANPLCVVDAQGKLVGVVSRYDIIKFFNESYLKTVVATANPGNDPFREFPTKSEKDVEEAVAEVQEKFLLVSKRRPLVWKYVAIAMFAAGLLAATALIIRIVSKEG